ncbi:ATP-binding protein [Shewanella sp. SR44-3]|uniref:ATP-binding protein n=1 Tax=Shewanella sp. SR44-3 TaxID=2760936 RepID=UPI0015F7FFED|nr:ATP-binding protein [Shewanella sp. SR44-3]MBB1268222.1 histidine kinase [Shewanella sp. SR44-3]
MKLSTSLLLKSPIGRRLMLSIVLFSSFITLITTVYQLINDYRTDVNRIDQAFSSIEMANLDVLAASIWVIDEKLINTQLKGLSQLPDITYVSIKDDSEQEWRFGTKKTKAIIEQSYQLLYRPADNAQVGTLVVQADLNLIYEKLYDKAVLILLSNAIKTFLVAGFILFLVWLHVTKHLLKLSQYCGNIDLQQPFTPLKFERKPFDDEFHSVAQAINAMQEQVRVSFKDLQRSKSQLQDALTDRERLLEIECSYKEELASQVKAQTAELELSLAKLKKAQLVLVEKEKMAALGGLVSGVAHEINTPIGICLTAASAQLSHVNELIKIIHSDDATLEQIDSILKDYQHGCELIISNITKASNLIKKFKTIAAEQQNEKNTQFNLLQQLMAVVDSSKLTHPDLDVDISLEIDPELTITTNYSLMNQIVSNIISNAYSHGFEDIENPKLIIKVELEDNNVSIAFHNNGVAIPEDIANHMFEPFFTTTRHKGGTGLGLSAAFNAATQLKGTISYQAQSPLGGPLFTVHFPIEHNAQHLI